MTVPKNRLPVVAIIGTAGAGKTQTASNTFKSGALDGWVYFINDAGNPDSVDLTDLADIVDLHPMANGCFSCEDDQKLRELITAMAKAYEEQENPDIKGVILEGYGFVAGDETVALLKKLNLPYQVVCVLDSEHFERNLHIYAGVMDNQVAAATAGVFITKYSGQQTPSGNEKLKRVLDFISKHNPWVLQDFMPRDGVLPMSVFNPKNMFAFEHGSCAHGCDNHDHGGHVHGHANHALSEHYYLLNEHVTAKQVEQSLGGGAVVRTKGIASGTIFHSVYDSWEFSYPEDDSRRFIIVYCEFGFDPLSIPEFATLVKGEEAVAVESTLSLIRTDTIPKELTLESVTEMLKSIPTEPVWNSFGQLVPYPEFLQIVKEISRRPNVKDEIYLPVINICCVYWVKCVDELGKVGDTLERANNLRELSISLGWWAVEFRNSLPPALLNRIIESRPAKMLAEGLAQLDRLNSNPEKAFWQVKEILKVCDFAKLNGESSDVILSILDHAERITRASELEGVTGYLVEIGEYRQSVV